MLKSTASAIAPAVTKLFNKSLTFGKFPIDQKTPIPKSSKKSELSSCILVIQLEPTSRKHIQQYTFLIILKSTFLYLVNNGDSLRDVPLLVPW